ncbi:MAG: hypothetical protein LBE99_00225 [Puniceicoccales bacterium]|jgi:hypothetical protein|nr:hypothetical protein [Puniceicoccales bacterium]
MQEHEDNAATCPKTTLPKDGVDAFWWGYVVYRGQWNPLSLLSKEQKEAFLWGCSMSAYQAKHPEVTQATYLEDLKKDPSKHDYVPNIRGLFGKLLAGEDIDLYPKKDFVGLTRNQINAFEWGWWACYMMVHNGVSNPFIGLTDIKRNIFMLGVGYACYVTAGLISGSSNGVPTSDELGQFIQQMNFATVVTQATMMFLGIGSQ